MAVLGKGTSHFNLLQGTMYAAISFGVALSSILSGYVVRQAGNSAGFFTLAGIGVLASLFFICHFRPRPVQARPGPVAAARRGAE
jgi:dipeptide/tripeptide permease